MFDPKSKKSSPEKRTFSAKNVVICSEKDMAIALATMSTFSPTPLRRSVRNLRKEDTTRRFRQSIEPLARVIVIHHPFLTVAHRARSHTAPPSPVARPRLRPSAKMFQRHTTERSSHRSSSSSTSHLSRSSAKDGRWRTRTSDETNARLYAFETSWRSDGVEGARRAREARCATARGVRL